MELGRPTLPGALLLALLVAPSCRTAPPAADPAAQGAAPGEPPVAASPRVLHDESLAALEARVAELERAFAEREEDPDDPDWVRAKLDHMVAVDQLVRGFLMETQRGIPDPEERLALQRRVVPRMTEIDERNTRDLKALIERHGWPSIDAFGTEADGDAWLLVQHADRDRDFQREVLSLLEELLPEGRTDPRNFAYLYDRVAVGEDRPQRYGTQGRCVGPGTWEPFPMEEPERVDGLRASVGLPPLDEYVALFVDVCP